MELLYIKETSSSVGEVGGRLGKAAQNHQFGVINVVDLREKMHSKGVEFGPACMIYEVCNPHRAKEVLGNRILLPDSLHSVRREAVANVIAWIRIVCGSREGR